MMTQEQKAKAYDEALGWMREMYPCLTDSLREDAEHYFPELRESEDERIRKRLIEYFKNQPEHYTFLSFTKSDMLTWLEKQKEQKPNYCHHEVDETGWTEEYRKAYYDGWNNCNMQHEQCKAEQKPVEWSEEDEKMRDRIIDILNRTFSVYSALGTSSTRPSCPTYEDEIAWLKSLRPQPHWKPGEWQMSMLLAVINDPSNAGSESCHLALTDLYEQLKKL